MDEVFELLATDPLAPRVDATLEEWCGDAAATFSQLREHFGLGCTSPGTRHIIVMAAGQDALVLPVGQVLHRAGPHQQTTNRPPSIGAAPLASLKSDSPWTISLIVLMCSCPSQTIEDSPIDFNTYDPWGEAAPPKQDKKPLEQVSIGVEKWIGANEFVTVKLHIDVVERAA